MYRIAFLIPILFAFWASTQAAGFDQWLALGDTRTAKWDHHGAAHAYQQAVLAAPNNYEALWKAASETAELGHRLSNWGVDKKKSLFELANDYADQAIAVRPDGWEGHFYKAVALGRLALFQGGKEKIRLARQIREEGEIAARLDPEADFPYHLLGRWHQEVANLNWVLKVFAKTLYGSLPQGSNEISVQMFLRAIDINPHHVHHHLELARTYRLMGDKARARQSLERVLTLPSIGERDQEFKNRAQDMLLEEELEWQR